MGDGPAVFIAVDAAPSDLYLQQAIEGAQPVPGMAVISNNPKIVPSGMPASSVNLLPEMGGTRHKSGLSVLNQLLLEALAPLDGINIVVTADLLNDACGGPRTGAFEAIWKLVSLAATSAGDMGITYIAPTT
ncbi:hypothetical protein G3I76_73545 [Streptomyces sp. SID11233]|nr:hypothetical protein [Streptomyces sp. SID11233]